jgi:transposase-like protein
VVKICRVRSAGWPNWARNCCCSRRLEAEVSAFLGRDRYERAAASEDPRAGMRNGYCPTTVKTTAALITLARPKQRKTIERLQP